MHLRSGAGEVHLGLSDVLLLLFELSRQRQGPAQKLVLQKNGLGADGCAAVVRTLRLWPRISKRLEHLCFLDNGIGDGGVAALADGLCAGALPRLRTLGLSGNSVSDAGARELARAVEHGALRTLRNLSLAQNNLSSDGVGALCASAKDGGLHQLRYLGLGSNSVGTTGAHALAMLLSGTELPRLSSLWLGQNPGIGTHGVLSVVVRPHITTRLRLRQRRAAPRARRAAARSHTEPDDTPRHAARVAACGVQDAFALRIARQLPHEVLWLQNTGVGDNPACISHVYRALQPVHPTLQPAGSGMLDTQMGGGVLMMMPRLAKLMMAPREPPRHVATSHSGGCAGYLEFLVLGALAPKTSEVLESAVRAYRDGDLRMLPCVSHWPGNRTACLLSDTVG